MRIIATSQSTWGPPDKPRVANPVKATLTIPVFYATERGPVPYTQPIFCGRVFAETVLKALERCCLGWQFGLVHIGLYNPRKARKADGKVIRPVRWSNHAYGEAMDFKGIVTNLGQGRFYNIKRMQWGCPSKLGDVWTGCEEAIESKGLRPEIVDEQDWLHIGIWQPR